MNTTFLKVSLLPLFLMNPSAFAAEESPYAGQEIRDIKALSDSDVAGLLAGKGMGLAKAAELNGYPGPLHVLELAGELELTEKQQTDSREIFNQMRADAKALGAELVAAERVLDDLFANRTIDEASLTEAMTRIGNIEARLREVHLQAHLRQARLLSPQQITDYIKSRGYGQGKNHHHHQNRGHD